MAEPEQESSFLSELFYEQKPPEQYAYIQHGAYIPADPAKGNLIQGWWTIALRPSLKNIAEFARKASMVWVYVSIAVGILLNAAAAAVNGMAKLSIPQHGIFFYSTQNIHANVISSIILSPITYASVLAAQALLLGLFAHGSFGTLQNRFERVLTPLALGSVGAAAASLVSAGLSEGITAIFIKAGEISLVSASFGPVNIALWMFQAALAIYTLALTTQCAAAGGTLPRWISLILLLIASGIVSGIFLLVSFLLGFFG